MNELYVVIGIEPKEGQPCWDIVRDLAAARKVQAVMAGRGCAALKIFHVDLTANVGDSFHVSWIA